MPVKLRNPKGRAHRITREAIEAFVAGDWLGLHRALGLRPWQPSPIDVTTPEPPCLVGPGDAEGWPLAWELRCQLAAASAKMEN